MTGPSLVPVPPMARLALARAEVARLARDLSVARRGPTKDIPSRKGLLDAAERELDLAIAEAEARP